MFSYSVSATLTTLQTLPSPHSIAIVDRTIAEEILPYAYEI